MTQNSRALRRTEIPGLSEPKRGKVRDVYDLGDRLLIVASDRLSAYDHVLEPPIPGKGRILTQLTNFWFDELAGVAPNHLLSADPADLPEAARATPELRDMLTGRFVVAKKARVIPFECVARGYLAGSGFKEYSAGGKVCGIPLPAGLVRASRLPEPIFTPATKAESGHDENVDFDHVANAIGRDLAGRLRDLTLDLYSRAATRAEGRGLILADTKFEFGFIGDELTWIDEALTPDSSRYWDAAAWKPGTEPASFDKQFVRNWLDASGWDHESPPPPLPDDVVEGTVARYSEAFKKITGRDPEL